MTHWICQNFIKKYDVTQENNKLFWERFRGLLFLFLRDESTLLSLYEILVFLFMLKKSSNNKVSVFLISRKKSNQNLKTSIVLGRHTSGWSSGSRVQDFRWLYSVQHDETNSAIPHIRYVLLQKTYVLNKWTVTWYVHIKKRFPRKCCLISFRCENH